MFPPHNAIVQTNEAGEPVGWDVPADDPYEPDDFLPDQSADDDSDDEDDDDSYDRSGVSDGRGHTYSDAELEAPGF